MRYLFAFLLFATPVFADCYCNNTDPTCGCSTLGTTSGGALIPNFILAIRDAPSYNLLFKMEPGACLKGPLKFFSSKGKELFSLDVGADYPVGCSKDQPK